MAVSRFCPDEAALLALGRQLARGVAAGQALNIHLQGDLGAGKTTLVRGLLAGLGHVGAVKSPTYGLVERYELEGVEVCHFDLYRLADPEELEFLAWRDLLDGPVVALFEWPERAAALLGEPDLAIALSIENDGRRASLIAHTPRGEACLQSSKL